MAGKSRQAVVQERAAVLAAIDANPSGLTHEQIRSAYAARTKRTIAYTTLRVRLQELEEQRLVVRSGGQRNLRYWPASAGIQPGDQADQTPTKPETAQTTLAEIPLSREASEIRSRILRPRLSRTPVGYQTQFLDDYTPGQTWYLPSELRKKLSELGRTAYMNQPAGTYARDIMQRLIIDLSWGSSRLEGNKYTRIDTEELIQGGREAEGATDKDRQMILNHKAAIEFIVENAQEIDFNRYTVIALHAFLSENLLDNPDDEGRLRTRAINIGNSVYTPTAIPQVIEERFDTILAKAAVITDPLEQSFFTMVHVPYLQPFIDVNKRTSRLAANISLIRANLCPLSFVDVPEDLYADGTLAVYELTDLTLLREVFAWAYERSCAQFKVLRDAMGEPDPIRLKYRAQLRLLVAEVVSGHYWPDDPKLRSLAAELVVPTHDVDLFVSAARRDLIGLRADILARYQLRPSQFNSWLAAIGQRPSS